MSTTHTKDFSTHRGMVTTALLLSMFMTAIEITIVATAMPRIVTELSGFAQLSWVFSAYLLTQVVSIPIYGKLADLYGRKPVFLIGVVIFLIASVLCGLATTMTQLIAFRFLQGLGGGAVQPIAVTIIGDLYKAEERSKIQGWIGSVFAISSIIGPALGAFIVDLGHWSWIFYLNVPVGLVSFAMIWMFLHEKRDKGKHHVDFLGALLLVSSISSLMVALLNGGSTWDWASRESTGFFALFFALFMCLLFWEGKAKEPMLPLWIFKHSLIKIAGIATFLNGAVLIGYSAMIPMHVQGDLGRTAIVAGGVLGGMSIGWPLASFFAGGLMKRFGFRKTAIAGSLCILLGSFAIATFAQNNVPLLCIAVFVVGIGLGFQSNAFMVTIQSAVSWSERGVATANNLFMRTLGSSVGAAAFGAILNSTIATHLSHSVLAQRGGKSLDLVNDLLDVGGTALSSADKVIVVEALQSGMTAVFFAAVAFAVLGVVITWILPSVAIAKEAPLPVAHE